MDIKESQKQELGFLIINFMFVMLGAFVTATGTANGSWELVAAGCIMMIAGNLNLWGMIKAENRPPQNNKTVNKLDA